MEALSTILPLIVAAAGGLCSLLFMVLAVGGVLYFVKRSGGMPSMGGTVDVSGLQAMYTDRLGYTSVPADDPGTTHMVRTVEGLEVHLRTRTEAGGMGTAVSYTWSTPSPSGLSVHVVEQSVADTGKRLAREAAMNRTRHFTPKWPDAFPTGSAALDARFRVFAPDARRAMEVAALEAELLACAHVELTADPTGVALSDPFQDGLVTRMGGPMGMAGVATAKGIEVQVRLHEEAAALLRACTRR